MKLLVVGGTAFVGRHAVEAAVADGHDVTVFHRGRTNPDLLAGAVTHRLGDRNAPDYASLEGAEHWDAVIDASAYVPRHVRQLADVIKDRCGHYVHVSSISAYDPDAITPDEDSPLYADLADPSDEQVMENYGQLKAMSERAAVECFGAEHTAVVRPTFVCGPHDHSDRFTYWVRRMARGGDVAVIQPDSPLQVIDGRDLGTFMVRLACLGTAGAFDGVGPWAPLRRLLADITPVGVSYRLVDVGAEALERQDVSLPMVSPDPEPEAFMSRPGTRARAAGLTTRPIEETAASTREWDRARGEPALAAGPTPEAEAAVLAA